VSTIYAKPYEARTIKTVTVASQPGALAAPVLS